MVLKGRCLSQFAAAAILLHGLSPAASAQIRADVYVSGLSSPLAFVQDPSNAAVHYIVEQGGHIRVFSNGALQSTDFLNLSSQITPGGEQGLLGLAFPPDYATSGRFYVNFTGLNGNIVVARFKRSAANPLIGDPNTRFDFLWPEGNRFITHPFSNHNGGTLMFGPDGYLYIGTGDGGAGNDPNHRAQNPNSLLGKLLRLNVGVPDSDVEGYDIPADNPFVGGTPVAALPEIWAFGLRNPWKFSFDDPARGGTGAMVIGDVGQGSWEEVDYQPPGRGGRNYGWRNREGAHDNVTNLPPAYTPLIEPIFEYSHSDGDSITGGFVYRGTVMGSSLRSRYFFADISGRVWSLTLTVNSTTGEASASGLIEHTAELGGSASLGSLISSFGVDASGELYVVSLDLGQVLRLSTAVPSETDTDHDSLPDSWELQYGLDPNNISNVNADPDGDGFTNLQEFQRGSDPTRAGPCDLSDVRKPDLIWRQTQTGDVAAWVLDGAGVAVNELLSSRVSLPWQVVGRGDVNGDGFGDLVWRHTQTGDVAVWLTSGRCVLGTPIVAAGVPLAWQIAGVGDVDGDTRADLVWRNTQTGDVAVWLMDGVTVKAKQAVGASGVPLAWQIVAVDDLDGDTKADLVWRETHTGDVAMWLMNGATVTQGPIVASGVPLAWQIAGAGDIDGDGKADLVWRHAQAGDVAAWLMNGVTVREGPVVAAGVPLTWQIAIVRDVDDDGKADLVWRQVQTGDVAAWLMVSVTVKQRLVLAAGVPLAWQIQR